MAGKVLAIRAYIGGGAMRRGTVFVHDGFACDPVSKTPPPLVCQSVAYEIDSAGSGRALAAVSRPRRRIAAE
jgi:hypothetical protein